MAIELIAKIKQANNGSFKLVDAIDIELSNGEDLQTFLDNFNPEGEGAKCHIGDEPPTDDSVIWIDTSQNDYSNSIHDSVINEFSIIVKSLKDEISQLRLKNVELEARILYLEENGIGGGGDEPQTYSALLLEDGSILTDELGNILIFEEQSVDNNIQLIIEDGSILTDELGNILILEQEEPIEDKSVQLTIEDNSILIEEYNNILVI